MISWLMKPYSELFNEGNPKELIKVPKKSIFIVDTDGVFTLTNLVQMNIAAKAEDAGKYAVSFVRDSNGGNYFVVPEVDVNGIWTNGLDGKEKVADCLQLFDNQQLATECLQSVGHGFVNQGYSSARVFRTVFHEQDQSLELCFVKQFSK